MRRRTVIPYDRSRRNKQWHLGDPPGRRLRRKLGLGRFLLLTLAAVLFLPPVLDAASLAWRSSEGCRVWSVVDGDTVRGWCPGSGSETIRLTGYDTPEFDAGCLSELGRAAWATQVLRWHLWTARESSTLSVGEDRYGRRLAALVLDGRPVHLTMIESGHARAYDGGRREGWCG